MMLGDDNENIRNAGAVKVLAHRKQVAIKKVPIMMTAPCTQEFDSLVRYTNSELESKCLLRISQF